MEHFFLLLHVLAEWLLLVRFKQPKQSRWRKTNSRRSSIGNFLKSGQSSRSWLCLQCAHIRDLLTNLFEFALREDFFLVSDVFESESATLENNGSFTTVDSSSISWMKWSKVTSLWTFLTFKTIFPQRFWRYVGIFLLSDCSTSGLLSLDDLWHSVVDLNLIRKEWNFLKACPSFGLIFGHFSSSLMYSLYTLNGSP